MCGGSTNEHLTDGARTANTVAATLVTILGLWLVLAPFVNDAGQ